MDFPLGKSSWGAVYPCANMRLAPQLTEDGLLAMDRTLALLPIVTTVSVQFCSLLDSSGRLQESSRMMLSYRQPICRGENR